LETTPPSPPSDVKPPGALKFFGIINIVLGTIGLLNVLPSLSLYFMSLDGQTGVMPDLLRSDPFYLNVMRVISIPGALFVFAQFVSGFGLLKALEWARRAAIGCAIYGLLVGTFVGWLSMTRVMPFMLKQTVPAGTDPAVAQMTGTIAVVAVVIGLAIGMLFPVLLLIFLTRPRIRDYCIATSTGTADR